MNSPCAAVCAAKGCCCLLCGFYRATNPHPKSFIGDFGVCVCKSVLKSFVDYIILEWTEDCVFFFCFLLRAILVHEKPFGFTIRLRPLRLVLLNYFTKRLPVRRRSTPPKMLSLC